MGSHDWQPVPGAAHETLACAGCDAVYDVWLADCGPAAAPCPRTVRGTSPKEETPMALPTMTPEQRAIALEKAAAARRERAEALAEIAAGRLTLADALSGEDPRLHRVKVHRVLTALPGVGKVTADRALAKCRVDAARRVKGLGPVQRKALTEHFAA